MDTGSTSRRQAPGDRTGPDRTWRRQLRRIPVHIPLILGTIAAFWSVFSIQAHFFIGRFESGFLFMPTVVGIIVGALFGHIITLKRRLQRERDEQTVILEREARYTSAVRGADFTIWDWRQDESLIFRTNAIAQHLGSGEGPDFMTREWWLEQIHPADRMQYLRSLGDHLAGKTERYVCEYRARHADGSYRWIADRGQATRDEQGRVLRVSGTSADVTERVLAEQALRDSEARLAGIVGLAPEAVISMSADLRITLFNQGAERIFGHSAADVIGRPVNVLVPVRFHAACRALIDGLAATGGEEAQSRRGLQIDGLRRDGSEFPAEISVARLQFDGEVLFTAMFHDVSERQEAVAAIMNAKEEAELANRAKSEFLANMSHELRTPLNAVLGFSEVMLLEALGPLGNARYREYAGDIHDSGSHLLSIINDVLDISRVEAGGMELVEDVVDLRQTADFTLRLLDVKAREKRLRIEFAIAPEACLLQGDERALKQILLNLMSNSVKFTGNGGTIKVQSELTAEGDLVLSVADDGIGIAEVDIPKVLSPFGQAASAATRGHEGTGLGLTLARKLAEMHDGGLVLQSRLGQGTTVKALFPAARVRNRGDLACESAA